MTSMGAGKDAFVQLNPKNTNKKHKTMSRRYDYEYPETPLIVPPTPHNCKRYEGKVVVITASTKGMGLAMATRFAEEGGKVVISSRKQNAVDEQVKILRIVV